MLTVGCKNKKADDGPIIPALTLYNQATTLFEQRKYVAAADAFDKIFFQHPGNNITPNAELMQAYSLYLAGRYSEAIDVVEMFIKLHPVHNNIVYAYYLKALASYLQISDIALDQAKTLLAKDSLEEVIERFPDTKYAVDARLKLDLVNDHLAGKEMLVGRYYLNNKNPIAAINRFEQVIINYQHTSHAPEALYRLAESYSLLGLTEEAKKYAAILGHNHPGSIWYQYGYNLMTKTKAKAK